MLTQHDAADAITFLMRSRIEGSEAMRFCQVLYALREVAAGSGPAVEPVKPAPDLPDAADIGEA